MTATPRASSGGRPRAEPDARPRTSWTWGPPGLGVPPGAGPIPAPPHDTDVVPPLGRGRSRAAWPRPANPACWGIATALSCWRRLSNPGSSRPVGLRQPAAPWGARGPELPRRLSPVRPDQASPALARRDRTRAGQPQEDRPQTEPRPVRRHALQLRLAHDRANAPRSPPRAQATPRAGRRGRPPPATGPGGRGREKSAEVPLAGSDRVDCRRRAIWCPSQSGASRHLGGARSVSSRTERT
jgi:hypothetical protein